MPQEGETPASLCKGQTWGWGGADQQALFGAQNYWPKLTGLSKVALELITATTMFAKIFFSHGPS